MAFTYWENKGEKIDIGDVLSESGFVCERSGGVQSKTSFWDSYDRVLLKKGFSVIKTGNCWQVWNVRTWESWALQATKRASEETPKFWQTYEQGDFQDWMKKNLGLNALIKMASFDFAFSEIICRNSDGKTVVKVDEIKLNDQIILKIDGLRGYEEEYGRLTRVASSRNYSLYENEWFTGVLQNAGVELYHEIPLEELLPGGEIPVRRAVSDMILNYLHIARFYEEGIQKDLDTECLHKYRVALRKIRSLISIIKDIYPEQDCLMLKQDFRELQQNTNHLRDLDVHLMEEDDYKQLLPETFREDIHPLFVDLKKERKSELSRVRTLLESEDYKQKMRQLEEYFERIYKIPHTADSIKPVKEVAKIHTHVLYGKMVKNIGKINDETPEEKIHDLRITGKKLRYLLEFFEPVLDANLRKKLVTALKSIQEELGKFNDQCSQIDYLSGKVDNGKAEGRDLVALGILIGVVYTRKQEQRKIVVNKISDFSSRKVKSIVSELTQSEGS